MRDVGRSHWADRCRAPVLYVLAPNLHKIVCRGCRNGRFGKWCSCPLPKTGGFDEDWRNFRYYILPMKTRDFAPQTPEIDENYENGGCRPGKMTVCQKHCFDNPEFVSNLRWAKPRASVIAAIRITSARWRSYLPPRNRN